MRWRTVGRIAATVFLGLVVPVAVAAVGIAGARGEVYTPRGPSAPPAPVDKVAVPTHDPGKPTAVILLGPEGANAADVLAPYEVFAAHRGVQPLHRRSPAPGRCRDRATWTCGESCSSRIPAPRLAREHTRRGSP